MKWLTSLRIVAFPTHLNVKVKPRQTSETTWGVWKWSSYPREISWPCFSLGISSTEWYALIPQNTYIYIYIYIYHFDFNIDFGDAPPCHVPLWILLYRCHVDNFLNGIYNDDLRVGGMGSSSLPPKSSDPNFHWFVVGYIFFQRNIC